MPFENPDERNLVAEVSSQVAYHTRGNQKHLVLNNSYCIITQFTELLNFK